MFKSHNGLFYPKLPLRLLACGLCFVGFSVVVWWIYLPMNSTTTQFLGFGLVVLAGLLITEEFVFRNFLQRTYWKKPWRQMVMHELAVPAGVAAFFFINLIQGPIDFFNPEPIEPSWLMIAARRWAWVFFLALGLFYGLLWLMEYRGNAGRSDFEPNDRDIRKTTDFNFLTQIDNAWHTELIRQQDQKWVGNKTWREAAKAYLETPPESFKKHLHYLGSPSVIPIYPYYCMDVMVADCNYSLSEEKLILANENDGDGTGKAGLLFKNRHETFPIPTYYTDMDQMVRAMAKILTPDYQLRYCRLASRHRLLQSLMCLRPEEWAELTDTYGKRKMRKYFSPIDNRFKALAFLNVPLGAPFCNVLGKHESPI